MGRVAHLRVDVPDDVVKYRPDIDGLRAVAVLAVVAYHAFPAWVRGGFVGVDVFFVISGYLITGIIAAGLRGGRFSFTEFYARRVRRIFPALALVLTASLAAGWFLLFADDYVALGRHVAGGAGFVANLTLWGEAGYFDAAADTKPLLHLWSLGIEEQFYLVWPLLLFLAWRQPVSLFAVTGLILALSFALNVRSVRLDVVAAFYSPVTRFWELLVGGALACAADARLRRAWREGGAALGLGLIAIAVTMLDAGRLFPGLWALLPTLGAALVIAAGPDTWVNRAVLSNRGMVGVGLISYPLYLWHWPLLSFARIAAGETPPAAARLALVLASIGLAWATFEIVEKPIRYGHRRDRFVPVLGTAMAVVLASGLVLYRSDGFVERAVNRSDQAHFLQYYDRMHKQGLSEAYWQACDFMDWPTGATRTHIDASCTQAGERATVLLWGDSYAQALSLGLRTVLPAGIRLAQVTASLCRPSFDDIDPHVPDGRCPRANAFAADSVKALEPDLVVLAQMNRHEDTDWAGMAGRILALGAKRVVLVGPVPRWLPSLPEVVTTRYWGTDYSRVSHGLDPDALAADLALTARAYDPRLLTYVSVIGRLCDPRGCVAVVPRSNDQALIALDAGHLTPKGSVFVAERVLRPYLRGVAEGLGAPR